MKTVTDPAIEKSWKEVSEAARSSSRLSNLMEKVSEEQPAIVELVFEALRDLSEDGRELGYHALLVICLSVDEELDPQDRKVSIEALLQRFHENKKWFAEQEDPLLLEKKLQDHSKSGQPELMRFLVELVLDASEDGLDVPPREQERLLLLFKSVIDCWC